jgi:probable rRNA maturation factor
MTPVIDIAIEAEGWSALDAPAALASAVVEAAVEAGALSLAAGAEVSIVLCDDGFIADLNRKWRGIDRPTNVLAFPSGTYLARPPEIESRSAERDAQRSSRERDCAGKPAAGFPHPALGDIVIALETAMREAEAAEITLRDHVAHLVAHGFLHLVGYDHSDPVEAEQMEALEVGILARLGISDPYGGGLVLVTG